MLGGFGTIGGVQYGTVSYGGISILLPNVNPLFPDKKPQRWDISAVKEDSTWQSTDKTKQTWSESDVKKESAWSDSNNKQKQQWSDSDNKESSEWRRKYYS
jgi:hypothetical protein